MPKMSFALTPARASHHSHREEGDGVREQKSEHKQHQAKIHTTVMLREAVHYLAPKKGDVVVDATYGQGGHSSALAAAAKITLVSIDADPSSATGPTAEPVIEGNFGDLKKILNHQGVEQINKALFDLGWNMSQLNSGRGFSFLHDEPLNMSYGPKPASGFTAQEIVNSWSEKVLADVFFGYGEERYARKIAKAIVDRRELQPIETTIELSEIIKDAVPPAYRRGRLHPATKTFQALRIAVNDELKNLERGLAGAWDILTPCGRIAVITFHSIEDRLVKRTFAEWVKKKEGRLVFKKPVTASREEVISNPPSRSAKLRVIEKICTP